VIRKSKASLAILTLFLFPLLTEAKLYIYHSTDGEKLISDRPLKGYKLVARRDSVNGVGHLIARLSEDLPSRKVIDELVRTASERYNLDPDLIKAIIQVESNFKSNAVSSAGAAGLMQLMPETAKDLNVTDRFNPRDNIYGGTRYMSQLLKQFNQDVMLALAAYHAGPGTVLRTGGLPNISATRSYISKVMESYNGFKNNQISTRDGPKSTTRR